MRNDISVGVQYVESWLRGTGAVAIFNLMEDAATAEIARGQLWQWRRHGAALDDGRAMTAELYRAAARRRAGEAARASRATASTTPAR